MYLLKHKKYTWQTHKAKELRQINPIQTNYKLFKASDDGSYLRMQLEKTLVAAQSDEFNYREFENP